MAQGILSFPFLHSFEAQIVTTQVISVIQVVMTLHQEGQFQHVFHNLPNCYLEVVQSAMCRRGPFYTFVIPSQQHISLRIVGIVKKFFQSTSFSHHHHHQAHQDTPFFAVSLTPMRKVTFKYIISS